MDTNRFNNLFPGLDEEAAISLLQRPIEDLDDVSDRYLAAAHLVNFPGHRTIAALIRCAADDDGAQAQRIARRKAVETLARLQASEALEVIISCLGSSDVYLVENAAWALAELEVPPERVQDRLLELLEDPQQSRRVVVQTLARLGVKAAVGTLDTLKQNEDVLLANAATAAVIQLTGKPDGVEQLAEHLQHTDVTVRRAVIQDLMDSNAQTAVTAVAAAPVSPVFRLRGVRHLGERSRAAGTSSAAEVLPLVDRILRDDPGTLNLVHRYDTAPDLGFLVQELYGTDFGRVYLAMTELLKRPAAAVLAAVSRSFAETGWNDYGAHYHCIHLFGRLGDTQPLPLVREALNNRRPQFQKSRPAAALALARLDPEGCGSDLQVLAGEGTFWELRYAALMALEQIGAAAPAAACNDSDWLVSARAGSMAMAQQGS